MGAAIGGRRTAMVATIVRILPRTVARITEVTVIIIQRLTMILLREPMAGNRLLMVLTVQRQEVPPTILTPGRMLEALQFRRLMGAEAQLKRIIRTQAPMLRRDRV